MIANIGVGRTRTREDTRGFRRSRTCSIRRMMGELPRSLSHGVFIKRSTAAITTQHCLRWLKTLTGQDCDGKRHASDDEDRERWKCAARSSIRCELVRSIRKLSTERERRCERGDVVHVNWVFFRGCVVKANPEFSFDAHRAFLTDLPTC